MALSKIKLRPKTVAFHIQNKTATNLKKSSMMLFIFGPSVTFHHVRMEATGPSPHPFCSSWNSHHHFLPRKQNKNFLVKNAQQPTRRVPSCGAGGCIHRPVEAVRCLSCGARTLRKGLLRPNVFLQAKEWAGFQEQMYHKGYVWVWLKMLDTPTAPTYGYVIWYMQLSDTPTDLLWPRLMDILWYVDGKNHGNPLESPVFRTTASLLRRFYKTS